MNSAQGAAPDKSHLQAAVQWYLIINDSDVESTQLQAWQQWLAARPEHASAWSRIEKLQQQLHGVPLDVALPVLSKMGVQRRHGLKLLMLLAAGAATFGGYRQSPYSADFATRTGQRRQVVLADGSQLNLNTDTQVDIDFNTNQRLIRLRHGEIFISTALDRAPSRPLSVETPHGSILALGTRFNVRLHQDFTLVSVQTHAVEVRPQHAPQQVSRVEAGQTLSFAANQAAAVRPADPDINHWTRGQLVVIEWRLADFIHELARYRPGYLGCAPEVADLRISGAFLLDDTDALLANLQVSLPVKVRTFSRYWVRIEA